MFTVQEQNIFGEIFYTYYLPLLVSVSDFLTIACFKRLDSSFKQRAVDSDALLAKEVQKGGRQQSLNKFFDQYSIINILILMGFLFENSIDTILMEPSAF